MDDGNRYTSIGHRGLAICNPCGSDQVDDLATIVAPARSGDAQAIDVGCGKAELLIRLAEGHGCSGVGIEPNPDFVAEARAAVQARAPGRVEIVETKAALYDISEGAYDVAAVVGATHAFGGTAATLTTLARATRRGGHVVLGDGFWRRTPTDADLVTLGATRDELALLPDLVAAVTAAGLTVLHVAVARDEDWDRYEWAHLRNIEAHLRNNPGDPQACRLWQRRQSWRDAYLRVGRDVMGFALIGARKQ